ncbi:hypothetical protein CLV75_3962 [Ruegeria conchae]|uniref:Uncharacterized protein n=1 Tax=Ruegeria conchae TaxID=981384 RepID=A0A497YTZ9_9RHOB|nr:hypothetical protein CLV75_3962 [Ruegeria conchae]
MGIGEAVKTCFSKYFQFSGRALRSEVSVASDPLNSP